MTQLIKQIEQEQLYSEEQPIIKNNTGNLKGDLLVETVDAVKTLKTELDL